MNDQTKDVFYYSRLCLHCRPILQFISKHGLIDRLSCICIDKRVHDPKTYQMYIFTENGKRIALPPVIHTVPSLLCVQQKCTVIQGTRAILESLGKTFQILDNTSNFNNNNTGFVEPISANEVAFAEKNQFVSVNTPSMMSIQTPLDTYQPNKLTSEVSIDSIQQSRNKDIGNIVGEPITTPFL